MPAQLQLDFGDRRCAVLLGNHAALTHQQGCTQAFMHTNSIPVLRSQAWTFRRHSHLSSDKNSQSDGGAAGNQTPELLQLLPKLFACTSSHCCSSALHMLVWPVDPRSDMQGSGGAEGRQGDAGAAAPAKATCTAHKAHAAGSWSPACSPAAAAHRVHGWAPAQACRGGAAGGSVPAERLWYVPGFAERLLHPRTRTLWDRVSAAAALLAPAGALLASMQLFWQPLTRV